MAAIVVNKPFVVDLVTSFVVDLVTSSVVALVTSSTTMVEEHRSSEDMKVVARFHPLVAGFPSFLDIYY